VKADFRKAALSEPDRLMLELVEKLTLAPWLVEEGDVRGLRRAGWSDLETLHVVLGCAHFNYLNRMADGLGIRLDYPGDLPAAPPHQARARQTSALREADADGRIAWIVTTEALPPGPSDPESPRNLLRAIGGNADAAEGARRWRAYHLAGTEDLDSRSRARVALLVGALDRCSYALPAARRRLSALGLAGDRDALLRGEIPASCDPRERAVLAHARRLTQAPASTREAHVAELRAAGLDHTAVVRLTMLVSYLSFEHRVASGLGVAPEPE
jgi:alkylhydroperoxidase family enzyme